MNIIYKPKGRAGEYGKYAINVYNRCDHGCKYCYVPACVHVSREEFRTVQQRKDLIPRLQQDLQSFDGSEIFLSFTCDPYCWADVDLQDTRKVICELLNPVRKIELIILTKAGFRSERDFGLLSYFSNVKYGTTLTFLQSSDSLLWEPEAAIPRERLKMLQKAKEHNLNTWASIEPVINPKQSLELIKQSAPFVDEFKIGKLNHMSDIANRIDWRRFASEAIEICDKLGKEYYIKQDLRKFL